MNSSSQKIEKNNRDISKIHFNIKTKTTELKLRQQNLLIIKNISTH